MNIYINLSKVEVLSNVLFLQMFKKRCGGQLSTPYNLDLNQSTEQNRFPHNRLYCIGFRIFHIQPPDMTEDKIFGQWYTFSGPIGRSMTSTHRVSRGSGSVYGLYTHSYRSWLIGGQLDGRLVFLWSSSWWFNSDRVYQFVFQQSIIY